MATLYSADNLPNPKSISTASASEIDGVNRPKANQSDLLKFSPNTGSHSSGFSGISAENSAAFLFNFDLFGEEAATQKKTSTPKTNSVATNLELFASPIALAADHSPAVKRDILSEIVRENMGESSGWSKMQAKLSEGKEDASAPRMLCEPLKYSGDVDFEEWFLDFSMAAIGNDWSKKQAENILPNFLEGEAKTS